MDCLLYKKIQGALFIDKDCISRVTQTRERPKVDFWPSAEAERSAEGLLKRPFYSASAVLEMCKFPENNVDSPL